MRRFSAEYLEHTRRGLWADRAALEPLDLHHRSRVLDVGCGTGALTRVIREETDATVVGLDADPGLVASVAPPVVTGDARRLPFPDDTFDLVVCQALLINLPEPLVAVREFARVSAAMVAVVEPDNAGVTVESTVAAEGRLARRAREAYMAGVATDVSLGPEAAELLTAAGLTDVETVRHDHERTVAPPYSEADLVDAGRKASGERLAEQRETLLAGGLTEPAYDELRTAWRAMGRAVVEQMRDEAYERVEMVPFYVSVGRV